MRSARPRGRATRRVSVVRKPINRNFVLIVFLFTVFAILHILLRNDIQKMLIEAEDVDREIQQLSEKNSVLQANLSVLTSSQYIHQKALEDLELIEPETPPIILWDQPEPELLPRTEQRMALGQ